MQSNRYILQSDLLAKGMTKETRILGVPFGFAISNIATFSMLMIVSYATTKNLWSMPIALGAMTIAHLVMMILSLHDEKALKMYVSNVTQGTSNPMEDISSYTPLNKIKIKTGLKERPVAKHLSWSRLYNEHTVMTKKGELLQVVVLDGLSFHTDDDITLDVNKNLRNRVLYQMASPELAIGFYTIRRKHAPFPDGDYTNAYAKAFNERYQNALNTRSRYENSIYIVLLHKAPKFKNNSIKSASGEKTNQQTAFYTRALKTLDNQSTRLVRLFKASNCSRLTTEDDGTSTLLRFLSELVNLESRPVKAPMQALHTYLPYKSHHFAKRKGIVQVASSDGRQRFAAILSLKEYPDDTHAALLDVLLGVDCELITTQQFYFKHQQRAKDALEKQQRKMEQTDDSVLLAAELNLAIEDVKSGRAAYGEHHFSICVIADDLKALDKAIYEVESRLNQEAGLITVREEQGVELAFWAQLPGNHTYKIRQSLISSLNMAGLANLHNYPVGRATGNHWGEAVTVLETVSGTSFFFNFHVEQVGNSMFIGPMGSGKTLLLSAFLAFTTKYGGWRYVFDKDRGMEIIVRALGGSYHVIQPGIPSGMAPLQLPDSPENRAFNVLLLKKLLSTTAPLSVNDEKIIEKSVQGAYELDPALRMYRNIAPFFGANKPSSLRARFDRWHSDGQHAWLFDNEVDHFAINNRISGQDIGNLLKPAFQDVSTPALMYMFHRLGDCLDSSPTAVFIPEGWKALSDPIFQEQLKDWSKTPRKNNMAVIMDTQSPEDLASSSAGASLAREASTQVFFANHKAEWKDYVQFNVSEKEFLIIQKDLPAMEGHYFLLKQGNNSVVARLNLKGMEDDIAVLSANLARVLLLDEIRSRVGDVPSDWLPRYTQLNRLLTTRYSNDFTHMKANFEGLWEQFA